GQQGNLVQVAEVLDIDEVGVIDHIGGKPGAVPGRRFRELGWIIGNLRLQRQEDQWQLQLAESVAAEGVAQDLAEEVRQGDLRRNPRDRRVCLGKKLRRPDAPVIY